VDSSSVRGLPTHTLSRGKLVCAKGNRRAERGTDRDLKRPAFGDNFDAARLRAQAPAAIAGP
jgi:dihydropyrimidinase